MSYNCMKDKGFIKIADWHLNNHGKLDINYHPSIRNVSGVIAILVNNKPVFFSSTRHYGPRIDDFTHSINGNTTHARIHSNIVEALKANETVSLWVKNSPSPRTDKGELLEACSPKWNL